MVLCTVSPHEADLSTTNFPWELSPLPGPEDGVVREQLAAARPFPGADESLHSDSTHVLTITALVLSHAGFGKEPVVPVRLSVSVNIV